MRIKSFVSACLIGLVALPLLRKVTAQEYSFVDVLFPGAKETLVEGINDAGVVVGTYGPRLDLRQTVLLGSKGFIRNGDIWQTLQPFGASATSATAINNHDVVVGHYLTDDNRFHGFVYDGMDFFDVLPHTADEAVVSDIDDNGVIIGAYSGNAGISTNDPSDIHGFRAIPDSMGGYTYELFDFPTATTTLPSGRNNTGVEVGAAIIQSVLGADIFGFVLPSHDFRYPKENAIFTVFDDVNDRGLVLGNAILVEANPFLRGHTVAFLLDVNEFGRLDPPTPHEINLPGPACGFFINPDSSTEEPCRKEATRINNEGKIVGYYDKNDGISRGFIGTLTRALKADFDVDGNVDGNDFLIWQASFGVDAIGDANGDGVTDGDDFLVWQIEFGAAMASTSTSASVPEPGSWLLLFVGLAVAATMRWCLRPKSVLFSHL